MKNLAQSAVIAFSMYSKIPMPRVDWGTENMKYAMNFFPLVGVPIGLLVMAWMMICQAFAINELLWATVAMMIPLVITGGIHLDGLCDTIDALSSHQSKERKLEIMKDPHIGAFAVMWVPIYLLLYTALLSQLPLELEVIAVLAVAYVGIRGLSGLSVVTFPCAKNSGLAAAFADGAAKQKVKVAMIGYLVICSLLVILINPLYGIVAIAAAGLVFFHYYKMSMKQFGGITGDLAGYFLQMAELGVLVALVAVTLISN